MSENQEKKYFDNKGTIKKWYLRKVKSYDYKIN